MRRLLQDFRLRVRLSMLHRDAAVTRWLALPNPPAGALGRSRVLAVITHVVSVVDVADPLGRKHKVERLSASICGLLESFAHTDLEIALATVAGRSVHEFLPRHLLAHVRLLAPWAGDPLYTGFHAQDELVRQRGAYDWFLGLEDDIAIRDSCFLEKVSAFNASVAESRLVVMPQRYEMVNGRKVYIDLFDHNSGREFQFDRMSMVDVGGFRFAECENSHSGMFCLSRRQMDLWAASGRRWYAKATYVGPLESAHTGALLEVFRLLKPVGADAHFLEVRHCDLKYGPLIRAATQPS